MKGDRSRSRSRSRESAASPQAVYGWSHLERGLELLALSLERDSRFTAVSCGWAACERAGAFSCWSLAASKAGQALRAGPVSSHRHLSPRWGALFWEESLLQSQLHVMGSESLGIHLRLRRYGQYKRRRTILCAPPHLRCQPLSLASFLGKEVAAKQTEVSGWWRRRLTLFHLSSIFYRLCGEATIVFRKAALPSANLRPPHIFCFCEADPSPALWAAAVWPDRKALLWAG